MVEQWAALAPSEPMPLLASLQQRPVSQRIPTISYERFP